MSDVLRRMLDALADLRAVAVRSSEDGEVLGPILAEADAAMRDGEELLAETEDDDDAPTGLE